MKTENLSTLKIHKLTQEQYDRELAAGNIDETALYLTPDEELTDDTSDDLVQGDWSQNDNSAPDYIKNRTHYEEFITTTKTEELTGAAYYDNETYLALSVSRSEELANMKNLMLEGRPTEVIDLEYPEYTDDGVTSIQFKGVRTTDGYITTQVVGVTGAYIPCLCCDAGFTTTEGNGGLISKCSMTYEGETAYAHPLDEKFIPNTIARVMVVNAIETTETTTASKTEYLTAPYKGDDQTLVPPEGTVETFASMQNLKINGSPVEYYDIGFGIQGVRTTDGVITTEWTDDGFICLKSTLYFAQETVDEIYCILTYDAVETVTVTTIDTPIADITNAVEAGKDVICKWGNRILRLANYTPLISVVFTAVCIQLGKPIIAYILYNYDGTVTVGTKDI